MRLPDYKKRARELTSANLTGWRQNRAVVQALQEAYSAGHMVVTSRIAAELQELRDTRAAAEKAGEFWSDDYHAQVCAQIRLMEALLKKCEA